ncbi:hypothetical protein LRS73_33740 (plasmid) [Methylobacterium currus]|uniref:hypothetical protein n=1 Tax=Methylobacterium currus TaxID=2051553 RepID=UPI001E2E5926|nr:hypothetical protein [Methylobacterium currus]UHC19947.1 hypothetical protein LRS73_33740 [Methylobacterium currus]
MPAASPAPHIAFGGEPIRRDVLLARLDTHRAAGTLLRAGARWTGTEGTPAGCIAGDDDPMVFVRVTGFPAALGLLLDFVCARSCEDAAAAAALAAGWLSRATPGADLSGVPGRIMLAFLGEAVPPDEPEVEAAREAVAALHRRAAGDPCDRAAWRRARALAVAATDAARGPAGQRIGRLVEAAAWDPLTSPSCLQDAASAWCEVRAHDAAAATGWTAADDEAVERCFQACRGESLAAGERPETFAFPPRFQAREPALARRFVAQLEAANAAYPRAVAKVGQLCADHLAAA